MEKSNQPRATENKGYLVVRVSTARGVIPLRDASVTVRGAIPENSDIMFSLKTSIDGLTPKIELPSPPASYSAAPSAQTPFSLWNIDVFKDGYSPVFFQNVPIYPNIVSVQPAVLVSIGENLGRNNTYNESIQPNL